MIKQVTLTFKKLAANVDWKLLLFLLLFLNIKLPVKIAAIVLIYLLQFDFKFKFSFKNTRLPLFYLLVIPIAVAGLLLNKDYRATNYMPVFFTGIFFWVLCILAIHQIKLIVDKTAVTVIHNTIVAFFILNALVSFADLALIALKTHDINPYTYMGMHQKYFLNTGDFVKGVTFDIAPTNAVLNVFGVIYFLFKRNVLMVMLCMAVMLLTFNNLICLIFISVLMLLFILHSSRLQKSIIVICMAIWVIVMTKVSPQNTNYITQIFYSSFHIPRSPAKVNSHPIRITQRPDSTLNFDEKRDKIATLYVDSLNNLIRERWLRKKKRWDEVLAFKYATGLIIPDPNFNLPEYKVSRDIEPDRKLMLAFIMKYKTMLPICREKDYKPEYAGKVEGLIQTVGFLKGYPKKALAGIGVGNFSSKIAFRAAGIGLRGGYPKNYTYFSLPFLAKHLDLYMFYYSKDAGLHSVTNNPFSVYDQMLAEYGILGLLALLVYYFGFFLKKYKKLSYGLPLLLFVAGIFFLDYWFEQLSVMVVFELLLFLNMKESDELNKTLTSHA